MFFVKIKDKIINKFNKNRFYYVCLILIIIGIGLNILALLASGSLNFDEIFTVEIAKLPIFESWKYLKFEHSPPLFFFLMHFWVKISGQNELLMRLPSLLIGFITIPFIYLFGKELFNRKVGLISAAIFSLAPFAITNNTTARMYSLLFLLETISCYSFWKIIKGISSKKIVTIFFISTLLILYLHLTGLFLLVSQGIFILIRRNNVKNKKIIISAILFSFFLYMPWLLNFFQIKINNINMGFLSSGWYFDNDRIPFFLSAPLVLITGQVYTGFFLTPLSCIVFILGIVFLTSGLSKTNRSAFINPLFFLWITLLVPIFCISIVSDGVSKYITQSALSYYLLFGFGIVSSLSIKNVYKKISSNKGFSPSFLISYLLFIFLIFLLGSGYFYTLLPKASYQEFTNIAEKNKIEVIITEASGFALNYYYINKTINFLYLFPKSVKPNKDILLNVTKYNWVLFENDEEEINNIELQLKQQLPIGTKRVGYFNSFVLDRHVVRLVLEKMGYKFKEHYYFVAHEPRNFYIFEKE